MALTVPGAATVPVRACRFTVAASLPALVRVIAVVLAVVAVSVAALMAPVCVNAPPASSVTSPAVPPAPLLMLDTTTALASV